MRLSARIICIEACLMLFATTCGEALAGGFGIEQSTYYQGMSFAGAAGGGSVKEAAMHPRTLASDPQRNSKFEPLYDVDARSGATIEVFYADRVLAGMRGAGWHWWSCQPGCLPEWPPNGPFATSYAAYRVALGATSDTERPGRPSLQATLTVRKRAINPTVAIPR